MSMMYEPLLISSIIRQAAINFPTRRVISRTYESGIVEHTYTEIHQRCQQLAGVLIELGVKQGDHVATLAWNTHRHLEAYFGISGIGAVVHTVNPRLYDEQIVYIINHAEDSVLLVDRSFYPLYQRIADQLQTVKHVVLLTDEAQMPDDDGVLCYETLLQAQPAEFDWPQFDEQLPSGLCYTSGTTGSPKGVMYTHRSTLIHSLATSCSNGLGLCSDTVVMPVVPMYHVSAWGVPYSAPLNGCTLVLPGDGMDGASLLEIINYSEATLLLGVPTVWLNLLAELDKTGNTMPSVKIVAVGGSAPPRALVKTLDEKYGIYLMPLWGMTETSPLATFGVPTDTVMALPDDERYDLQVTAGKNIWGIELDIVDDEGKPLPRDGVTSGNLVVRGHWIIDGYYHQDSSDKFINGWFDTGDVATIDAEGYLRIVDRKKDVIKSGGEWISSIDLENAAVAHDDVREACVVGVPHPKWDERPLLFVVLKEGAAINKDSINALLAQRVAKWWLPDDIIAVDELPHTATGKLQKNVLRDQYISYLSDSREA